jgi:oligosaccharide repeat unit polymerase
MIHRTPSTVTASPGHGVWWLNPVIAFGVPALIAGATAWLTDSADYLSFWRTAKYFDLSCFELLIAVVAVFSCGCLFGTGRRGPREAVATDWTSVVPWPRVITLFRLSFVLTVVAYAIWFAVGIKNGLGVGVILDIIHGASGATYNLREEYLKTIPGVTTATQFGLAVIALGIPIGAAKGWRTVRWQCAIVFVLAVVRALLNSERLALIELLVPFVVATIWLRPATTRLVRGLTRLAPMLAGAMLYLFFAASEYFRSWSQYYSGNESSFWGFIALRLMGYYTTALNNGALLWTVGKPLGVQTPILTLSTLWRFPVLKDLLPTLFPSLGLSFSNLPETNYMQLLNTSANPEFNNPSGVFCPVLDYGVAAGLLYWLLCGVICGYLYKEFQKRSVAGIFLYPSIYISLIEVTRVLYWADGRFFPPMFLLVVAVLFVFQRRKRSVMRASVLAPRMAVT